MTPNILLFPEWGKILFSLADVGIVYLIYSVRILIDKNKHSSTEPSAESSVCDNLHSRSERSLEYNDIDINNSDESKSCDSGLNFVSISRRGSSSCDDMHSTYGINHSNNGNRNNNNMNKNKIKHNDNASHSYDDKDKNKDSTSRILSHNNIQHNTNIHTHNDIHKNSQPHLIAAWLWALNPLAINICSRGSADSLTNCMVLALLYCLLKRGRKSIYITVISIVISLFFKFFKFFMSFIDGNQIPLLHIIVQYFYQILLSMKISTINQILRISGLLQNIFMNLQEN